MAGPELLDFDKITAPIEGESATGPDLRKDYAPDAIYRAVKEARQRAGKAEKVAWSEDVNASDDWQEVFNSAPDLLYTLSKDLEVACWLTEAMLRLNGFAGLRDGFRACTLLVENFWDTLHPNPDPEDEEDFDPDDGLIRVAALSGLNGGDYQGTLIAPLKSVNLVDTYESGSWGLSSFEQAVALQQISDPDERAKRLEYGAVTMEQFVAAAQNTSPQFYQALAEDLDEAKQWYEKLIKAIEDRVGYDLTPPSSSINNTIDEVRQRLQAFINEYAPSLGEGEALDEEGEAAEGGESVAGGGGPAKPSGPLQTREQAFSMIRQAAEYFRKTEPHSVLSWQLEECVKWGQMSLPDLFKELINDEAELDNVYKRVGIPKPENPDEESY